MAMSYTYVILTIIWVKLNAIWSVADKRMISFVRTVNICGGLLDIRAAINWSRPRDLEMCVLTKLEKPIANDKGRILFQVPNDSVNSTDVVAHQMDPSPRS